MSLNIKPEDLGTHSLRKGCATHVGKNPGGPDNEHVNTRAGWKNSSVYEVYHKENGGYDRYVGRFCCGFNVNNSSFASLPPHFRANEQLPDWNVLIPNLAKRSFSQSIRTLREQGYSVRRIAKEFFDPDIALELFPE